MQVTTILKGRVDKNGHQPVQIRVTHEGRRTFFPTHIKVQPSQFKDGKIVNHPKASEWNNRIMHKIILHQAQVINGMDKKAKRVNLFDYAAAKIRHMDRAPGTLRQYAVQIGKLKTFAGDTLYLHAIDHDFLDRLKSHLKSIGNLNNTTWNAFKFLKKMLSLAVKDGLIDKNPFDTYESPVYLEPPRTYLTADEVKLIDKFAKDKRTTPEMREAALWFLIGCYSGLRLSDIKAFDKKKNIIGKRLVVHTQKTSEIVGLPLTGKLKAYLQAVNYQPLSMHENTYNFLLKAIAAAVGINKRLHAHVARHTAAMLLADSGISIEVTSKVLAHKKLTTTAIYYRISNKRIDDELKKRK